MKKINEEEKSPLQQIFSIRTGGDTVAGRTTKPRRRFQAIEAPQGVKSRPRSGNITLSDYVNKQFGNIPGTRISTSAPSNPMANLPILPQRLAASYDPLINSNGTLISENIVKKLKSAINQILSNPPHSKTVENLKKQFKK